MGDIGAGTLGSEPGIECAGDPLYHLQFNAFHLGKTGLRDRNRRFRGKCLNPGRLHASETVEQANPVLDADDGRVGARGTDTRLALAAALPCPLIPAGGLRSAQRRIGTGAREILEIDPDHVARPDIGLQDDGIRGFEARDVGGQGGIACRDPRQRFFQT